jgi:hydrogenase maturation protease
MDRGIDALVLGIGNVLWADEGFGVRAVEALNAGWTFPANVRLMDGGTLGLNLYEDSRRHACWCSTPSTTAARGRSVLRGAEVPAWGAQRLSPHQNGFNDVLALAQIGGRAPEHLTAIGVQP